MVETTGREVQQPLKDLENIPSIVNLREKLIKGEQELKALIDGKINLSDTISHTMNNNIETEMQKHPREPKVLKDIAEGVLGLKTNKDDKESERFFLADGQRLYENIEQIKKNYSQQDRDFQQLDALWAEAKDVFKEAKIWVIDEVGEPYDEYKHLAIGGTGKTVGKIIKVGYQYLISRDPQSRVVKKAHISLTDQEIPPQPNVIQYDDLLSAQEIIDQDVSVSSPISADNKLNKQNESKVSTGKPEEAVEPQPIPSTPQPQEIQTQPQQTNELLSQSTSLEPAQTELEPAAPPTGEAVPDTTPLVDSSHELTEGEEPAKEPDSLKKQMELYGGEENYRNLINLYEQLKTENSDDDRTSFLKSILFQEYAAVSSIYVGAEQAEKHLNSLPEEKKEKIASHLLNLISSNTSEKSKNIGEEVICYVHAENSKSLSGEAMEDRRSVRLQELKLLTSGSRKWQGKDLSLLFIDDFKPISLSSSENQPAEENSTEGQAVVTIPATIVDTPPVAEHTAGSTETQNKEENGIDEATSLSTEEQAHTNHLVVEAPENEAQTDTVAANITSAAEAPETEEQQKIKEGMKALENLFEAVKNIYDQEKMQSPHFIYTVNEIQKFILDTKKTNIFEIMQIGHRLFMEGEYSPSSDSPVGIHSLSSEKLDESTYTLFSVAWNNFKQILLEKFYIATIDRKGKHCDPSIHLAFGRSEGAVEANQVARMLEPGFQFAANHPEGKSAVLYKARVTRGDRIEDDRQLDPELKNKYSELLAEKISVIERDDSPSQPPAQELARVIVPVVEAPENEAQTDTVAADTTLTDEVPVETEEEKQTREAKEQKVTIEGKSDAQTSLDQPPSGEEINMRGVKELVDISKMFKSMEFDKANSEEVIRELHPELKIMVSEELENTISNLPESDIKNIFTERENIDKLIDSVIAERTKAEANITAIMGSAVFTNEELMMLRAINTRAVMRKTLGEFDSDLDKERLDEIINIITPLCFLLKPQNAEQLKITKTNTSTT